MRKVETKHESQSGKEKTKANQNKTKAAEEANHDERGVYSYARTKRNE